MYHILYGGFAPGGSLTKNQSHNVYQRQTGRVANEVRNSPVIWSFSLLFLAEESLRLLKLPNVGPLLLTIVLSTDQKESFA